MIEPIHILTSESKLTLKELLVKPISPEELARKLGMTRQAVDKHLKDLLKYGIVEKIWVTTGKRPRLEFKISVLGSFFYESLNDLIINFKKLGREDLDKRLKSLDVKIIEGEVDMKAHGELSKSIEKDMEWFLQKE